MKNRRLLPLDSIEGEDAGRVGGKALQLARLVRGGFRVPHGFCIAAAAYREHLESNDLGARVRETSGRLGGLAAGDRQRLLGELGEAILRAPLPRAVREAIEEGYRAVSERATGSRRPLLALRSSATAEDLPEHSFAGLHDTFLGVTDLPACLESVKRCWASLWSDRAFEYRRRNAVDHEAVDMAVIVQELVPADAAGIIFTADPVSGRRDRLVLEATEGLGEPLVSGRIAPDRVVLSREGLAIIERSTATKNARMTVVSGTLAVEAIPEEHANRTSIDDTCAVELARLALAVEDALGYPVDVEWARAGGETFLLQARPITTGLITTGPISTDPISTDPISTDSISTDSISTGPVDTDRVSVGAITTGMSSPAATPAEARQVWTNANTGEVVPDVVTPMTWSIAKPLVDRLLGTIFATLGLNLERHSLLGLVAGRVYFNLNTALGCLGHIPGLDVRRQLVDFFGGHEDMGPGGLEIADEDIPDIDFSLPRCLLRLPPTLLRFLTCTSGKVDRVLDRLRRETRVILDVQLDACSDEELVALLRRTYRTLLESTQLFVLFGIALTYQALLYEACGSWLGDSGKAVASRLLAGLGTNDNANAGIELWKLAVRVRHDADLQAAVLAGSDFESLRKDMQQSDAGREFLGEWAAFMTRHGHHCRGEIELINPRWSETPDELLAQLKSYVRAGGEGDFLERYEGLEASRAEAERECRSRLRNPLKRLVFAFLLRRSQQHAAVRENFKSEIIRRLATVRRALLELGGRLARRGVLADREAVFFLELGELESVLRPAAAATPGVCPNKPRRTETERNGRWQGTTTTRYTGEDRGEGATKSSGRYSRSRNRRRQELAEGFLDRLLEEKLCARRSEYESNRRLNPPALVVGRFETEGQAVAPIPASTSTFQGVAVHPGVVTGPARVILRAGSDEVLPGEILVAPFTDPGWTPYFLNAAAIVMDLGGLLSHGSIIAREYGIPAVVNVGTATARIRTGQTLRVDGACGTVEILEEEGCRPEPNEPNEPNAARNRQAVS